MWNFWEFIVSGRLPGTTIQITFEHWLYAISGILLCALLRHIARQYLLHHRNTKLPERPIEAFVNQ